ncbi:MAG TPA: Uma2 family endonuclease [Enhygromyxa sp.]|nr:Uma2 family endonuclease [Enhygromyxa sp.]
MPTAAKLDETPPMSLADWADMLEDEPGEFVDGRLEEEEMPSYEHEIVAVWLMRMLGNWLEPRGGFVGGSDAKFAVRPNRGRKPDVSAYMPGRKPPRWGLIEIPPDIMIEVVSPTPRDGRRDRVAKLEEYAAFGVRWYWLVDPQLRSLEVLELGPDGRYVHALAVAESVVVERVPGCEGLTLDLGALWSHVDRLAAEE